MNKLTKVLLGVGIAAAATTVGVYVITKKPKTVKVVDKTDDEGNVVKVEVIEEGDSILERIEEAALKKAIVILSWAILNKKKIEAVGALISLFGGIFTVINAVKEYRLGKVLHKKIDVLTNGNQILFDAMCENARAWNHRVDTVDGKFNDVMGALNDISANLPKKVVKIKAV